METAGNALGGEKLTVDIRVYSDPELKELLGEAAKKDNVPLSEYIVRVLADHVSRPDLRIIPRKIIGRPLGSTKTNGRKQ